MPIDIIKQRDLDRVPWKNGGGTTCEVAASPAGAGMEAFDWRLSMADVGADGPFSTFAGSDRTLVLIEGRGVELTVDGVRHQLSADAPMLRFPGESFTTARLIDGPIGDLNVMSRRSRYTHGVERLAPGMRAPSLQPGDTVALIMLDGSGTVHIDQESYQLDRFDTLIAAPAPGYLATQSPAMLVRIWAAGP